MRGFAIFGAGRPYLSSSWFASPIVARSHGDDWRPTSFASSSNTRPCSFSGDASGVCMSFLLLRLVNPVRLFSCPPTARKGRKGLDWAFRLKFGAVIWFRAWRGKGSRIGSRERGVKNLRNLRGVIEGGRCSFLSLRELRELLRGERFKL